MPPENEKQTRCHACGGAGVIPANHTTAREAAVETCPACNGTGVLEDD